MTKKKAPEKSQSKNRELDFGTSSQKPVLKGKGREKKKDKASLSKPKEVAHVNSGAGPSSQQTMAQEKTQVPISRPQQVVQTSTPLPRFRIIKIDEDAHKELVKDFERALNFLKVDMDAAVQTFDVLIDGHLVYDYAPGYKNFEAERQGKLQSFWSENAAEIAGRLDHFLAFSRVTKKQEKTLQAIRAYSYFLIGQGKLSEAHLETFGSGVDKDYSSGYQELAIANNILKQLYFDEPLSRRAYWLKGVCATIEGEHFSKYITGSHYSEAYIACSERAIDFLRLPINPALVHGSLNHKRRIAVSANHAKQRPLELLKLLEEVIEGAFKNFGVMDSQAINKYGNIVFQCIKSGEMDTKTHVDKAVQFLQQMLLDGKNMRDLSYLIRSHVLLAKFYRHQKNNLAAREQINLALLYADAWSDLLDAKEAEVWKEAYSRALVVNIFLEIDEGKYGVGDELFQKKLIRNPAFRHEEKLLGKSCYEIALLYQERGQQGRFQKTVADGLRFFPSHGGLKRLDFEMQMRLAQEGAKSKGKGKGRGYPVPEPIRIEELRVAESDSDSDCGDGVDPRESYESFFEPHKRIKKDKVFYQRSPQEEGHVPRHEKCSFVSRSRDGFFAERFENYKYTSFFQLEL